MISLLAASSRRRNNPVNEHRKRGQEMKIESSQYSDSMAAVLHIKENEIRFS
jgi:hypothetical protein